MIFRSILVFVSLLNATLIVRVGPRVRYARFRVFRINAAAAATVIAAAATALPVTGGDDDGRLRRRDHTYTYPPFLTLGLPQLVYR